MKSNRALAPDRRSGLDGRFDFGTDERVKKFKRSLQNLI